MYAENRVKLQLTLIKEKALGKINEFKVRSLKALLHTCITEL